MLRWSYCGPSTSWMRGDFDDAGTEIGAGLPDLKADFDGEFGKERGGGIVQLRWGGRACHGALDVEFKIEGFDVI